MGIESNVFDVENILGHKKGPNGKKYYLVKWKGYDSSQNSWEPEDNFASIGVLMKYHEERKKSFKKNKTTNHVETSNTISYFVEKELDETLIKCEFVSEQFIEYANLSPKKLLNITHVKGEENNLVAEILFEGANGRLQSYVYAEWANRNCPHLVIEFYESRIYWKSTGELINAELSNTNINHLSRTQK